jgi:hypothetical protein
MANPYRVATNIATNQLTWCVLCKHPTLGALAERFLLAHKAGLERMASEMAGYTANSLEAQRFINLLTELLASNRLALLPNARSVPPTHQADADRIVGWCGDGENKGTIYLYPSLTIDLVKRLGNDDLGNVSKNTLYEQLAHLGLIASHDKDKSVKTVRGASGPQKMLHLTALVPSEDVT